MSDYTAKEMRHDIIDEMKAFWDDFDWAMDFDEETSLIHSHDNDFFMVRVRKAPGQLPPWEV